MNRDTLEMMNRLARYVPNLDDALALRRISMTLHRWHELECGDDNGCIERDEDTNKPYWLNAYTGKRSRFPIPDRKTGALKRLDKIMAQYPDLGAYVQTDPRGAALYIYKKADMAAYGNDIDYCYSSIGCAVYK